MRGKFNLPLIETVRAGIHKTLYTSNYSLKSCRIFQIIKTNSDSRTQFQCLKFKYNPGNRKLYTGSGKFANKYTNSNVSSYRKC